MFYHHYNPNYNTILYFDQIFNGGNTAQKGTSITELKLTAHTKNNWNQTA